MVANVLSDRVASPSMACGRFWLPFRLTQPNMLVKRENVLKGCVASRCAQGLGEQALKNIKRPVRVYRVRNATPKSAVSPALPLPDKPSIAVLPFANMSRDPTWGSGSARPADLGSTRYHLLKNRSPGPPGAF